MILRTRAGATRVFELLADLLLVDRPQNAEVLPDELVDAEAGQRACPRSSPGRRGEARTENGVHAKYSGSS